MRTTIYIPDKLVDGVKEAAWRNRKSVSKYFLDLHLGNVGIQNKKPSQPEKSEKTIVENLKSNVQDITKESGENHYDEDHDWGA